MEYIRAAPNKAKTNLRYLYRQEKRVVRIQAEMFVNPQSSPQRTAQNRTSRYPRLPCSRSKNC